MYLLWICCIIHDSVLLADSLKRLSFAGLMKSSATLGVPHAKKLAGSAGNWLATRNRGCVHAAGSLDPLSYHCMETQPANSLHEIGNVFPQPNFQMKPSLFICNQGKNWGKNPAKLCLTPDPQEVGDNGCMLLSVAKFEVIILCNNS